MIIPFMRPGAVLHIQGDIKDFGGDEEYLTLNKKEKNTLSYCLRYCYAMKLLNSDPEELKWIKKTIENLEAK